MAEFKTPERTKMSVTIYGKAFQLNKPNVKMTQDLLEGSEGLSNVESLKRSKEFVCKLGIDMATLDDMEIDHFNEFLLFLIDQVKKN